jgi:hypothetical protein
MSNAGEQVRRVGGGLAKSIELRPSEEVIAESLGYKKFFLPFASSADGTLVVTTERLIWLPYILFFFWEKRDAISITDIRTARRVVKPWWYWFFWGGVGRTVWWILRTDRRDVRFGWISDEVDNALKRLADHHGWVTADEGNP